MKLWIKLKEDIGTHRAGSLLEVEESIAKGYVAAGLAEDAPNGLSEAFSDAFKTEIVAAVGEVAKALRDAAGEIRRPGIRIDAGESEADKTKSFGDWLRHVPFAEKSAASAERLDKVYGSRHNDWLNSDNASVKALAMSSGVTGGYTVPPQYRNEIMMYSGETAIMRPRAFILPMATYEVDFPILDQTTVPSGGNSAFFGGVVATWTAEAEAIPETEPRFKQDKLTAHELTGYTKVSRTLLANSGIAIDSFLTKLFGGVIAHKEDYAFLRGTGAGQPLGILNSSALVVTANARGSATAISAANVNSVYARILPECMGSGFWLVSQGALEAILGMAGVANQVFIPNAYVASTGGAIQAAPQMAIHGRPLLVSSKTPTLNTQGDLVFIHPQSYIIGDPGSLEIAASEHVAFLNNQITYRFVHRVAGMPWVKSPITLEDGTTTVGPFVALKVN